MRILFDTNIFDTNILIDAAVQSRGHHDTANRLLIHAERRGDLPTMARPEPASTGAGRRQAARSCTCSCKRPVNLAGIDI